MKPSFLAMIIDADTRAISLTSDAVYPELVKFRLLSFQTDYRRHYPGSAFLSSDVHDAASIHIIFRRGSRILGACRIVPSLNLSLTFSDSLPDLKIGRRDFELSRFIVFPGAERSKAFIYLLYGVILSLETLSNTQIERLFADIIIGCPRTLNLSTYIEFGFRPFDLNYFDHSYSVVSHLICLEANDRHIFFGKVRRIVGRWQPFTFAVSMDSSVIRSKLTEF